MISRIVFVVIVFTGLTSGCEKPNPLWAKVYEGCLEEIYSGAGTPPAWVVDEMCRGKADQAINEKK